MNRLERLRVRLAVVEALRASLLDSKDPRGALLGEERRQLEVAIAEEEGRSLTGSGWLRP